MKMRIMTTILAVALAFPAVGIAAQDKSPGAGPNPYSDCGIGAALFPNIKPLAVISNIIWDVGTTAITSATVSPETCSGKKVEAAAFILESYDSLAEETARGNGDHIVALLNIMEVAGADRPAVVASIRKQMASAVVSDTYLTADKLTKASIYYSILITSLLDNAA